MKPAIFLDRDGVIIENRPNYVRNWGQVKVYPQALQALAQLTDTPFAIVIVTNQSGIGRGLIPRSVADDINQRLVALIQETGGRVDAVYMCPHKPKDACACRKPQPGLLLDAAKDLDLDLQRSVLIGDALTDLQAGRAAGVQQVALVLTGRGTQQARSPQAKHLAPFPVFPDLKAALQTLAPRLTGGDHPGL